MKHVQPLLQLKQLLKENAQVIARLITLECGQTYAESVVEMQGYGEC